MVPEMISGSSTPSLVEHLQRGEARRLGVQRVEHGLDQQHVGAALDQAARLLGVGLHQLVEADVAEARIVDVGRDRGRAVGRARCAPATKRGRSGVLAVHASAAARASLAAARFIS